MAGGIPPEMLAEIIGRALRPRVALPIENIDAAAADVHAWIDGQPMRIALMEGMLAGIRLGSTDMVPREAVGTVASAIIAAGDEAERARRSAGGKRVAANRAPKITARRQDVRETFDALPERLRKHPQGAGTVRALRERLTSLNHPVSDDTIKSDLYALGILPVRGKGR